MSPSRFETWLHPTPSGLFCPPGGFYIDPVRPVPRAVITHGHSDHARPGHEAVLATPETLAVMRMRLGGGAGISQQALAYGEMLTIGDLDVTLRPAGHILGSAQVVLEYGGQRAVVSGDYKRRTTRPARRSSLYRAICSSPRRRSACPFSDTSRTP